MNNDRRTQPAPAPARSPWRSIEELGEVWGLSRARTDLVVKALVRSGRMEARRPNEKSHAAFEYRLIGC